MDPIKLLAVVLLPLLAANAMLWQWYTHKPGIALMWLVLFIASSFYMKRR